MLRSSGSWKRFGLRIEPRVPREPYIGLREYLALAKPRKDKLKQAVNGEPKLRRCERFWCGHPGPAFHTGVSFYCLFLAEAQRTQRKNTSMRSLRLCERLFLCVGVSLVSRKERKERQEEHNHTENEKTPTSVRFLCVLCASARDCFMVRAILAPGVLYAVRFYWVSLGRCAEWRKPNLGLFFLRLCERLFCGADHPAGAGEDRAFGAFSLNAEPLTA